MKKVLTKFDGHGIIKKYQVKDKKINKLVIKKGRETYNKRARNY